MNSKVDKYLSLLAKYVRAELTDAEDDEMINQLDQLWDSMTKEEIEEIERRRK